MVAQKDVINVMFFYHNCLTSVKPQVIADVKPIVNKGKLRRKKNKWKRRSGEWRLKEASSSSIHKVFSLLTKIVAVTGNVVKDQTTDFAVVDSPPIIIDECKKAYVSSYLPDYVAIQGDLAMADIQARVANTLCGVLGHKVLSVNEHVMFNEVVAGNFPVVSVVPESTSGDSSEANAKAADVVGSALARTHEIVAIDGAGNILITMLKLCTSPVDPAALQAIQDIIPISNKNADISAFVQNLHVGIDEPSDTATDVVVNRKNSLIHDAISSA